MYIKQYSLPPSLHHHHHTTLYRGRKAPNSYSIHNASSKLQPLTFSPHLHTAATLMLVRQQEPRSWRLVGPRLHLNSKISWTPKQHHSSSSCNTLYCYCAKSWRSPPQQHLLLRSGTWILYTLPVPLAILTLRSLSGKSSADRETGNHETYRTNVSKKELMLFSVKHKA